MATYQIVLDERHFCNVTFPDAGYLVLAGSPNRNKLFVDEASGKVWLRVVGIQGPYDVCVLPRYHDICWSYNPEFSAPLPNILWQLITLFIINTERYRNGRAIIE